MLFWVGLIDGELLGGTLGLVEGEAVGEADGLSDGDEVGEVLGGLVPVVGIELEEG